METALDSNIILITGSSGLIGSATVKRLGDEHLVVGFDKDGPPHPPPQAECVGVDLTSDESVREGLARVRHGYGTRIASVIHLAAYYDFSGDPSPLYEQLTVRGTERLLRELESFEVEQFVFSSSMLVHAPSKPGEPIDEDSPLASPWDYPRSKLAAEQVLRDHHGDVPIVILRIAGVYDDRCHSIPIAHQIQRIFERRLLSHVFPGDVSHGQAFVHLNDVMDALALAIDRRRNLPDELTLLIGEPETLSYEYLQKTLGHLIHHEDWETKVVSKPLAKAGAWLQEQLPTGEEPFIKPWMIDLADDHYELDISRARDTLGWQPRRSLLETLPVMIAELEADPLGWYRANKLEPPRWLEEAVAHRSPAAREAHPG
jgi:UDP-glucose 4-epimerase